MSKSVEELFRDAPADATHYAAHCHYKLDGDTWMVHISGDEWDKSESMYNGQIKQSDIVARLQPKPWSGQEDGLPPVNTECQYWSGGWEKCLVIAHLNGRVAFTCPDDTDNERVYIESSPLQHQFKAIKTQKQIAAETRETAIRELMDIAQVDCRVTAARLVDAGFKREVV